jgi:hypothetical protein
VVAGIRLRGVPGKLARARDAQGDGVILTANAAGRRGLSLKGHLIDLLRMASQILHFLHFLRFFSMSDRPYRQRATGGLSGFRRNFRGDLREAGLLLTRCFCGGSAECAGSGFVRFCLVVSGLRLGFQHVAVGGSGRRLDRAGRSADG